MIGAQGFVGAAPGGNPDPAIPRRPKKDRIVRTTRSKSREETPKEGMNGRNRSSAKILCAAQMSSAFPGPFPGQSPLDRAAPHGYPSHVTVLQQDGW